MVALVVARTCRSGGGTKLAPEIDGGLISILDVVRIIVVVAFVVVFAVVAVVVVSEDVPAANSDAGMPAGALSFRFFDRFPLAPPRMAFGLTLVVAAGDVSDDVLPLYGPGDRDGVMVLLVLMLTAAIGIGIEIGIRVAWDGCDCDCDCDTWGGGDGEDVGMGILFSAPHARQSRCRTLVYPRTSSLLLLLLLFLLLFLGLDLIRRIWALPLRRYVPQCVQFSVLAAGEVGDVRNDLAPVVGVGVGVGREHAAAVDVLPLLLLRACQCNAARG